MSFKCIGCIIITLDNYWTAVVANLWKARNSWKRWMWMLRIMGREGSDERMLGTFFNAVVYEVILFGSETWVMDPRMGRKLLGLQNRGPLRMM